MSLNQRSRVFCFFLGLILLEFQFGLLVGLLRQLLGKGVSKYRKYNSDSGDPEMQRADVIACSTCEKDNLIIMLIIQAFPSSIQKKDVVTWFDRHKFVIESCLGKCPCQL